MPALRLRSGHALEFAKLRTYPIARRHSKVKTSLFAAPLTFLRGSERLARSIIPVEIP